MKYILLSLTVIFCGVANADTLNLTFESLDRDETLEALYFDYDKNTGDAWVRGTVASWFGNEATSWRVLQIPVKGLRFDKSTGKRGAFVLDYANTQTVCALRTSVFTKYAHRQKPVSCRITQETIKATENGSSTVSVDLQIQK